MSPLPVIRPWLDNLIRQTFYLFFVSLICTYWYKKDKHKFRNSLTWFALNLISWYAVYAVVLNVKYEELRSISYFIVLLPSRKEFNHRIIFSSFNLANFNFFFFFSVSFGTRIQATRLPSGPTSKQNACYFS